MTLGPLEYTIIGFSGGSFDGSIAREIAKVVDQKIIRVVDAVVVARDASGEATVIEIDAKEDPRFAGFAPLLENRMGLFTPEDLATIVQTIPDDTAALVILFEHRWAEDLKDAIGASGGVLLGRAVIPPEVLEEVSAELEAQSAAPGA